MAIINSLWRLATLRHKDVHKELHSVLSQRQSHPRHGWQWTPSRWRRCCSNSSSSSLWRWGTQMAALLHCPCNGLALHTVHSLTTAHCFPLRVSSLCTSWNTHSHTRSFPHTFKLSPASSPEFSITVVSPLHCRSVRSSLFRCSFLQAPSFLAVAAAVPSGVFAQESARSI